MAGYYPDDTDESSQSQAEGMETKPDKEEGDYETFLIPKSAFGGKEFTPGMTETIECVHEYEDELECRCAGKKEEKKSAMDDAEESLGKMAMREG